jgi:hypothetical protein
VNAPTIQENNALKFLTTSKVTLQLVNSTRLMHTTVHGTAKVQKILQTIMKEIFATFTDLTQNPPLR